MYICNKVHNDYSTLSQIIYREDLPQCSAQVKNATLGRVLTFHMLFQGNKLPSPDFNSLYCP